MSRYKARICVNGSKQKYGIDYLEVFSPVANQVTIRLILALAVHHDLEILQFDIKLAFVSSKIDRPVYMKIPSGAKQEPGKIWQLLRSLYGLKQAPRLFNASGQGFNDNGIYTFKIRSVSIHLQEKQDLHTTRDCSR